VLHALVPIGTAADLSQQDVMTYGFMDGKDPGMGSMPGMNMPGMGNMPGMNMPGMNIPGMGDIPGMNIPGMGPTTMPSG
jgi:hypothetical protein